jgi:hypothetical protein
MSSHLHYEIIRQNEIAARYLHAQHVAQLRAARPSRRSVSWRAVQALAVRASLRPRRSPAFSRQSSGLSHVDHTSA